MRATSDTIVFPEDRLFHWAACLHQSNCAAETSLKVTEIEAENPGDFNAFGKYMKGTNYKESFQESGDTESSVWSCGLTLVRAQPPALTGSALAADTCGFVRRG